MGWGVLFFLGEPWFVLPWYGIGLLGVLYLIHDMRTKNTALKPAMKWAWPIIVLFFSVIGLVLYFTTARAPQVGKKENPEEKKKTHHEYEESGWRRVNGAVIHCVAGDGLGIMTAMVIARAASMSFWQEFWFEYLVGFLFGWFLFQRKSMAMMTDNLPMQLAMAFRAEFFSMLTVMGGMGAVMTYVTPMVATSQPKPLTSAFWGFGMLGLLVGFVLTFPMNWMMIKVGWKHGMGGMEEAESMQVHGMGKKAGWVGAMVVLGCAATLLPAWLTYLRMTAPIRDPIAATTPSQTSAAEALSTGLNASLDQAIDGLREGGRAQATMAMDEALRAAEVGAYSAPGSFYNAMEQIRAARLSLQHGSTSEAIDHLQKASAVLQSASSAIPPLLDASEYRGALVIDQKGAMIGKVAQVSEDSLQLALGGWYNAWGFIDFSTRRRVDVPTESLAFGPPRTIGYNLVLLPTQGG